MKIARGSYLLLSVVLGISTCCVVKLFSKSDTTSALITFFSIDPRFSEQEQQAIALVLEQERLRAPATLAHSLKQKFPAIDFVSVAYSARADQEIEVRSVNPLVRVNDDHVLCDRGPLLASSLYHPSTLQTLHTISMKYLPTTTTDVQTLREFVGKVTPDFHTRFAVDWRSATQALFRDKTKPDFVMIADGTSLPSAETIKRCDAIYTTMKEQQTKKDFVKKNTTLVTDTRFEKQIIAYFKSGEGEL